jgi:hypothetical protein
MICYVLLLFIYRLKEERSLCLWEAIEKQIPGTVGWRVTIAQVYLQIMWLDINRWIYETWETFSFFFLIYPSSRIIRCSKQSKSPTGRDSPYTRSLQSSLSGQFINWCTPRILSVLAHFRMSWRYCCNLGHLWACYRRGERNLSGSDDTSSRYNYRILVVDLSIQYLLHIYVH